MKRLAILFFLILSISSFSQQKIIDLTSEVNFGYKATKERNIDIIVVHSTYAVCKDSFDVQAVLRQFKSYGVCSHYIIGRDGQIYYLVGENNIAYHAGISSLPGTNRSNLNGSSIGIELINTTKTPPTEAQYQSLIRLIKEIKTRHDIRYIVRHSDIAPGRKTDPWMFNWESFLKTLNEEKP